MVHIPRPNVTSSVGDFPAQRPARSTHSLRTSNNTRAAALTVFGVNSFRDSASQESRVFATHSPIIGASLHDALIDYPDGDVAAQLKDGFQFGFRIGFIGERIARNAANQQSIFDKIAIARQKI